MMQDGDLDESAELENSREEDGGGGGFFGIDFGGVDLDDIDDNMEETTTTNEMEIPQTLPKGLLKTLQIILVQPERP